MSEKVKELIAQCKEEIRTFERPTARNSEKLLKLVESFYSENPAMKEWIKELEDQSKEFYGDSSQPGNLYDKEMGIFYRPGYLCKSILIHGKEVTSQQLESLLQHMKGCQK